jgi:hypothetical protein
MTNYGSEPMSYDDWKSGIIESDITIWKVLLGHPTTWSRWKFWKWPIFDFVAVGRFQRFLVDWVKAEVKERKHAKS